MTSNAPSARHQRGFTLIEILVTVVLVSVGLLGIAALQLTTLRSNQEAYVRSQASVLSADILDRMRANAAAFREGKYDIAFDGTGPEKTRAGDDLSEWQATIDRTLPGGAKIAGGRVERDKVTQVVTVTIQWQERASGDGTASTTRTFVTRSEI